MVWHTAGAAMSVTLMCGCPSRALNANCGPSSPPDWTPCHGDLRPALIRRLTLERILLFDHHPGWDTAVEASLCCRALAVCFLWYQTIFKFERSELQSQQRHHLSEFIKIYLQIVLYWNKKYALNGLLNCCTALEEYIWNPNAIITSQGSWIAEFSSLNSLISLYKSSNLNRFQMVGVWPDQSASLQEKEGGATGRI